MEIYLAPSFWQRLLPSPGLMVFAAVVQPRPTARRPGCIVVPRADTRTGSRMVARARVGLQPGGREAGRAWCQGGLSPERAALQRGWILGNE